MNINVYTLHNQNDGVGMYTVGFGDVRDTAELIAQASEPSRDYSTVFRRESDVGEQPGLMVYNLKRSASRLTWF